ncbi:MAG TPA: xanthine dehydrogenase family protein subunit M [Stellaceae bacterium]|jgi:carbon-monoxide dehydrogenase medium subunit|nr:xanthine dehydrogenase family protein subunit M [Stellaceae bacterium]
MRFEAPTTVSAAVKLLAGNARVTRVLAGGTDLLVQMRTDRVAPDLIIDVKRIPSLRTVTAKNGAFRIGAAVAGVELGEHKALRKAWPGVVEAANLIGSHQIQSRASLAGNLCNASPAADSVPALVAAGASAVIAGPRGKRTVPVETIATGPGKTSLKRGEMVEAILLPKRPPRSGDAYLRFIPRSEMDIAVVGAGVSLTLDAKGVCTAARLALGAVAERVILVPDAAKALIGSTVDARALERLAAAASAACRPIDDKRGTKEFRIKVAGVLARRAAVAALKRARGA